MICDLLLVVSSFSLVGMMAGEAYRAKRQSRAATARLNAQRRVVFETHAVCSQVCGYCWNLEQILQQIAHPRHGEAVSNYCEAAREALLCRPPIVPLLSAIDSENWHELDRLRSGRMIA